jgi:transporter family-2 protein
MKLIWILIALFSGALLPLQAGLNTRLGKSIESPVYASLISFVVGAFALIIYITLSRQPVSWAGAMKAPSYVWLAGIMGAFYVTAVVLAFPRLGPALTFGLVVAGQMLMAVLLDHFHVLVQQAHSFTWWRLLGILMIIGGVVIVRKF